MNNFVDHWYQSPDGLRLYARDYPCRGGESAGTVLCMHGLTRNSADFAHLADYLCARYRVVSVDQRGRGRSDYDPQVARYTPAVYVQDMFALLDRLGVDSVILIGTSMGGLMSMMMTAMQPERIRAVVINDIGPEINPAGLERIKGYVGRNEPAADWDEAVRQTRAINDKEFPGFSAEQWLDFTRGLYCERDGLLHLAYDPAIAQPMADDDSGAVPPDLWPVFEAMAVRPLLVVRGELSDILAPVCVDGMRQRKADMHYAEIPQRGHAPMLNEAAAVAAIDRFLAEI
jgi:pimeloyl-ACP methyl ester carboxylesterase